MASFELGPTLVWDYDGSTAFAATTRVGLELNRLGVFAETRVPFLELAETGRSGVASQPRREVLLGIKGRGMVGFVAGATSVLVVLILSSFTPYSTSG